MTEKVVKVVNESGLSMRAVTFFIKKANEFKSSIWMEKNERRVNAKKSTLILSVGIKCGDYIKIIADGRDEKEAVNALYELVESGFSEEYR